MSNIIELEVSTDKGDESKLRAHDFIKTDINLNEGAGGNSIYLWYKKGSCAAITRIQFSYTEEMTKGLISDGYRKIDKDLNAGAHGDSIYLWYKNGSTEYDVPIQKLDVTKKPSDEAQKFRHGWERLTCDLNRGAGGNPIYLWLKREKPTYICDIDASAASDGDGDFFSEGYIRMDENTNQFTEGVKVFIWYRQTTDPKRAITDLEISTNRDEYDSFQNQGYKPVNQDLQEGAQSNEVFLWYKKDDCCKDPIKAVSVIRKDAAELYESVGVQVIEKAFIRGHCGCATSYLCFIN